MGTTKHLLLLSTLCIIVTTASSANLAAISLDLGTQFIKIGLVKPGVPMEIVLSKESRRKMPFAVGIRNGERVFGDAALQMAIKSPEHAFVSFLPLLGKTLDHPHVKKYQEQYPHHTLVKDYLRSTIAFKNKDGVYPVESLLAMILWGAKDHAQAYAKQPISDVVITVPSFFNRAERTAIAIAAEIAGLNLLQLLTDGSAAGLNYGVFRRKSITEQPQNMLIYDIGHSKVLATIVEYKLVKDDENPKEDLPRMSTLAVGFNKYLGGNELTLRLQRYLLNAFNRTHKTSGDITKNPRSMAKLYKEAERLKHVLSANVDHFGQVENLFEDKDFRTKVSRNEFQALFEDIEQDFVKPIVSAMKMAQLSVEQIDQIVLMGAGTRVPRIQQLLQEFYKKDLGRFLNTDEAAAVGAVYQAATLTQGFKVKKFGVEEMEIYNAQVLPTVGVYSRWNDVPRSLVDRITYEYLLSKSLVNTTKKFMAEFETREKRKVAREAAFNALESTIYDLQSKFDTDFFEPFRAQYQAELDEMREKHAKLKAWIDDVDDSVTTKELTQKKKELDAPLKSIQKKELQKQKEMERKKQELLKKKLEAEEELKKAKEKLAAEEADPKAAEAAAANGAEATDAPGEVKQEGESDTSQKDA